LKTQQCRIGRNPSNDLVINDRAAEDFHAVIMLSEENLIFIEDQNSRYGTMVNGERITKVQLFSGDEVQIGFCRIDWESRTGFQPSLNEIEVIPNLSVPIKRPIQHNTTLSDKYSNNDLNQMSNSFTSKELANSLIETEAQMDRIEHSISQIETVENSESINEVKILTEDRFKEINIATPNEAANEEFKDSESNHENAIISNHSDHLHIIEPKKEEVILNNESKIENDLIDYNAPPELHQEIHHIETPIVYENKTIENEFNSTFSEESNSSSPQVPFEILDSNNEQVDTFNASLNSIANLQKKDMISKDSIQILLAFVLTCILLAAGWLLGQAS
jgi:hypothetical protein